MSMAFFLLSFLISCQFYVLGFAVVVFVFAEKVFIIIEKFIHLHVHVIVVITLARLIGESCRSGTVEKQTGRFSEGFRARLLFGLHKRCAASCACIAN